MVDTRMVAVPRQPNTREENKSIKNGLNHFGDQNQIEIGEIGVKHKLIGRDEVRPASVDDRNVWEERQDENNSRQDGWADSADEVSGQTRSSKGR